MPPHEFVSGAFLVVLLVGIVGYFSWQELRNLRRLRLEPTMPDDDRRRIRYRALRRLFCCVLLLVLAGLLIGNYFIDRGRARIMEPGDDQEPTMSPQQREFIKVYSYYWIVLLLVLLSVILVVGYDLWSLLRWSVREQRRLKEDHREMLEHEVAAYLRQRNGHKGH
jgi:hypothetical protein